MAALKLEDLSADDTDPQAVFPENSVSTHRVPKEIRLDDERTLVLDPSSQIPDHPTKGGGTFLSPTGSKASPASQTGAGTSSRGHQESGHRGATPKLPYP